MKETFKKKLYGICIIAQSIALVIAICISCDISTSSRNSRDTDTIVCDTPKADKHECQECDNSCCDTITQQYKDTLQDAAIKEISNIEKIDDNLYRLVDNTPIKYYTFDRTDGVSTYICFNRHLKEQVKNDNCIEFVNYLLLTPEGSRLLCTSLAITAMLVVIILYLLTKIVISIICRPRKTRADFVPAQARECHLREADNTIIDKDVEVR